MGIEPTLEAWEAAVLPLNYTRPIQPARLLNLIEPPLHLERRAARKRLYACFARLCNEERHEENA